MMAVPLGTRPGLGPFQDAVAFEAMRAIAVAVEQALERVAAQHELGVDELKEWLAWDAALPGDHA